MIYVTRHGQTDWNIDGLYQGDTDTALNETGLRQARELRDFLAHIPLDRIISSTLSRARITAETVNELHHVPHLIRPELIERGFGRWEGTLIKDHLADPCRSRFTYLSESALPYGIESAASLCARVFRLLDEVTARYAGETVLIVTHGGTIGAVNAYFRGFGEDGRKLMTRRTGNCDLLAYSRREDAGGTFPDPLYSGDH